MTRTDLTLLIFTKKLSDNAWDRWSKKENTIVVTNERCSLKSEIGPDHPNLWSFERLSMEV